MRSTLLPLLLTCLAASLGGCSATTPSPANPPSSADAQPPQRVDVAESPGADDPSVRQLQAVIEEPAGHGGEPPAGQLQIDFQHGFAQTPVVLRCGDRVALDRIITTEPSMGVASSASCPLSPSPSGEQVISVQIGRERWRSVVDVSKGRMLGVELREGLELTQSVHCPLYD